MTILDINKIKPIVELSNSALIAKASSIGTEMPYFKTSNKYSFIPTVNAVDHLRKDGWKPISANQSRVNLKDKQGFQRHVVRFTKPELTYKDQRMELVMYNSHDAGSSFRLCGGIYRLVCANGMVIGRTSLEFIHRHINFQADDFIESAKFIADHLEKTVEYTEQWKEIELEKEEELVFAESALEYIYPEHSPITHLDLLNVRRREDEGHDLWNVFNRVQENAIKGGITGRSLKGRKSKTRKITDIIRDKNINQALWAMAETMAGYKQAA